VASSLFLPPGVAITPLFLPGAHIRLYSFGVAITPLFLPGAHIRLSSCGELALENFGGYLIALFIR
jgi:hypothetical protein